ncbi:MAG: hypothetical protein IIU46_00740 [Treponema sp.]|nr:hypothetical protein [Treponema sp.]
MRDEEIRAAALDVVKLICPDAEITWKESTASILVLYPADKLNPEKLKPLVPLLLKIEPKIRFYTPKKKDAVLAGIGEIKNRVEAFH